MSKKLFKELVMKKHADFIKWASKTRYFKRVKDKTSTAVQS